MSLAACSRCAQVISEVGDWLYAVSLYSLLLEITGRAESIGITLVPIAGHDQARRAQLLEPRQDRLEEGSRRAAGASW